MMQEDRIHQQHSNSEKITRQNSSAPPCCGSGCAVCVLDYWTNDEFEPVTQESTIEHAAETPAESFAEIMSEAEILAMLEAIEHAQQRAKQIIAEMEGESQ